MYIIILLVKINSQFIIKLLSALKPFYFVNQENPKGGYRCVLSRFYLALNVARQGLILTIFFIRRTSKWKKFS